MHCWTKSTVMCSTLQSTCAGTGCIIFSRYCVGNQRTHVAFFFFVWFCLFHLKTMCRACIRVYVLGLETMFVSVLIKSQSSSQVYQCVWWNKEKPPQAAISPFYRAMMTQPQTCTLSRPPRRRVGLTWPEQVGLRVDGGNGHMGWLWEMPVCKAKAMVLHWWQASRPRGMLTEMGLVWRCRGVEGQTGGTLAGGGSQLERDVCCQLSHCVCTTVENTEPHVWGSWPDLVIPPAPQWLTEADLPTLILYSSCHIFIILFLSWDIQAIQKLFMKQCNVKKETSVIHSDYAVFVYLIGISLLINPALPDYLDPGNQ